MSSTNQICWHVTACTGLVLIAIGGGFSILYIGLTGGCMFLTYAVAHAIDYLKWVLKKNRKSNHD